MHATPSKPIHRSPVAVASIQPQAVAHVARNVLGQTLKSLRDAVDAIGVLFVDRCGLSIRILFSPCPCSTFAFAADVSSAGGLCALGSSLRSRAPVPPRPLPWPVLCNDVLALLRGLWMAWSSGLAQPGERRDDRRAANHATRRATAGLVSGGAAGRSYAHCAGSAGRPLMRRDRGKPMVSPTYSTIY